jgi:hypothetical protein
MRSFWNPSIHHFYLGDWWHGLADLGLFILMVMFYMQGNFGMTFLVLLIDGVHTVLIFYYLIIEKWRDGQGRPVVL